MTSPLLRGHNLNHGNVGGVEVASIYLNISLARTRILIPSRSVIMHFGNKEPDPTTSSLSME